MIELQNVSKYYYTDTSVTLALNKISIKFPSRGFVVITGESGSGKSTLLNVISGLDTFDDGEMLFKGKPTFQFDAADWEEYRRNEIGFVFQNYGLIDHYTALDNCKAALLIQGMTDSAATKKAKLYLEKVGLKDRETLKAGELSSGQKQRLSIARALAKNTDIIVADEPTGNLDSETSAQIISLLAELSKEKLIIMVTHDYEYVENVATMKIRLHDGDLVSSLEVNQGLNKKTVAKESDTSEDILNTGKFNDLKVALRFMWLDLVSKKSRTALFIFFFLFTSAISFFFFGEIFSNADDRITKEYDSSAFINDNDKRILIKREDGKKLTKEDVAKLKKIKYVTDADIYDFCHDISYYVNEGSDYVYVHGDKQADGEKVMHPEFSEPTKFMMSSAAITEDDVKDGNLPSDRLEVALYSKNLKPGDKVKIFLKDDNLWDDGEYYENEFTVTGILKKKTSQIYFAPNFTTMLTASLGGPAMQLQFYYSEKFKKFYGKDTFYIIINNDLGINEIRASKKYRVDMGGESEIAAITDVNVALVGVANLIIKDNENQLLYDYDVNYNPINGEYLKGTYEVYNYANEKNEEDTIKNYSDNSPIFLEVSEELFCAIYGDYNQSYQGDCYITDYSKTDRVIKNLAKEGYVGISTYRVSTTKYIPEKVMNRFVMLCISVGVLLVLFILQVLIIRSLMKIKINDYYIFKFMGMKLKTIDKIVKSLLVTYAGFSFIVVLFIASLLALFNVKIIRDMMQYYTLLTILIYLAYILILAYVSAVFFLRLLRGKIDKKAERSVN